MNCILSKTINLSVAGNMNILYYIYTREKELNFLIFPPNIAK